MDKLSSLQALDDLPIEEWESLKLEEYLINETLDEVTLHRIKKKVKTKISSPSKEKRNSLHWRRTLIAVLFLCLIPITGFAISNMVHFIPQLGSVIQSNQMVYQLKEKQMLHTSSGLATLNAFVFIDNERAYTSVTLEHSELEVVVEQATLWINDVAYPSYTYGIGGGSDEVVFHHEFINLPALHSEDLIRYEWKLSDGTINEFEVVLEESQAHDAFESLGPSSMKEGINLTAIVDESPTTLSVTLVSQTPENIQVIDYKPTLCQETECGVYLIDALGKTIQGQYVFYHDRSNELTFDTAGLTKPYQIVLPKIVVHNTQKTYDVTLTLPDYQQTLTQVETLKLGEFNVEIDAMSLKEGQKNEAGDWLNKGEPYLLDLNVRLDSTSVPNHRLLRFNLQAKPSLLLPKFRAFNGYGAIFNEKGEYEELLIGLRRPLNTLNLEIRGLEIEVLGNWTFLIE